MLRWLWNRLMKWGWDFNRDLREVSTEGVSSKSADPLVRLNMYHAMNGKILEIATRSIHKNHDWVVDNYIIADGENLTDALAILLIAKGIK